ncbi:MAG: M56 family metallopeptidase, partial [Olleya sp.]
MEYFLKASAIIVLFYICYKLLLQRETYFQSNRWFLLIGLFLATVLPLVVIPIYIEYTPVPITFYETTQAAPQHIQQKTNTIDFTSILMVIYLTGTLFFFGKVMLQFLSLSKLIKNHKKTKHDQFVFIETEDSIAPFSFFNRIVFNTNQFTEDELNHVITHEKIHAKQYHSIDIILIQMATILFWFNPFIWWYKKALQQNLEFIADYKTQLQIDCAKSYQTVLLKASLSQNQLALPTNFYQSLIKKRIIMLQKSKSKNSSYFKLAIVLPFLGLFLMSFNTEDIYVAKANTTLNEINTEVFTITSTSSDKEIDAIKNRLEVQTDGLKIRFTDIKRNSDGEITNLSIETKSKDKSDFTKHVTYKHKDGKPIGNIALSVENGELVFGYEDFEMNMKVTKDGSTTILSENTNESEKPENKIEYSYETFTTDKNGNKSKSESYTPPKKLPLYVLNGKIVKENEEVFTDIDPDEIVSVNVLKDKKATDKYGKKGENGVVEITTKTQDNKVNIKQNDSIKKENPWKIGKVETSKITAIYDNKDTEEAIKNDISFIKTEINLENNGKNNALIIINGKVTDYE